MKTFTAEELQKKLQLHNKWLCYEEGGERADLSYTNLSYTNLSYTDLSDADLSYTNLSDANLSDADLSDTDLSRANLSGANLSGANLSGTKFPEMMAVENLFSKIKEAVGDGNGLEMASWHTCETTHCIAGWAIHLAGDAGRVVASLLGSSVAGALIIRDSCSYLEGKTPNFYASNEEGLNFINECAEKESALVV